MRKNFTLLILSAVVATAAERSRGIAEAGYVDADPSKATLIFSITVETKQYGQILREDFFYKPKPTEKQGELEPVVSQAGGGYGDGNGFNYRASVVVDAHASPSTLKVEYQRTDRSSGQRFERAGVFKIPMLQDFSSTSNDLIVIGKWSTKEPNKAPEPTPPSVTPPATQEARRP